MDSERVDALPTRAVLDKLLRHLAEQIRELRSKRRMTQQTLATASHLDRAYISSIENAKTNLTLDAIVRLADALEVNVEELFNFPRSAQPHNSK